MTKHKCTLCFTTAQFTLAAAQNFGNCSKQQIPNGIYNISVANVLVNLQQCWVSPSPSPGFESESESKSSGAESESESESSK